MMSNKSNMGLWSVFGMIVAGIIFMPLFMKALNYFNKKNNFDQYLTQYYKDTVKVTVQLPNHFEDRRRDFRDKPYNTRTFTGNYAVKNGRDVSSTLFLYSRKLFDPTTKRYYLLVYIGSMESHYPVYDFLAMDGRKVHLVLNRKEFKNPLNGTFDNPCLVFGVQGHEKPIEYMDNQNSTLFNMDIDQTRFLDNAKLYFTYILSKENFRKRFAD